MPKRRPPANWSAFWDSEHSIYVNARHRDAHYRIIADQIASYIPSGSAIVLDYGCGEALHADRLAALAARLILVEAASSVRGGLVARYRGDHRIEVRSPSELAAMPACSIDLIVINSVIQYLAPEEFDALLSTFHRLLRANGLLLIGDVVPPHTSMVSEVLALLRFAAANGFLWAAVGGLIRTGLSDYWRLRSRLGLARYTEGALLQKLENRGFRAFRASANLGHNRRRMTFRARPAP
jgi:SAM-dependent methyltransferase